MKMKSTRLLSILLAVTLIFGVLAVSPFAASADIAVKTSASSCVQGGTITAQVYFPAKFSKVASMDLTLKYDSTKLEVVSVKKGKGFTDAANNQTNGDVFSENHKVAGKINWALAGSNNYAFSGVFSEIVFNVKTTAQHGDCALDLVLSSAANSGYVDVVSSITLQDGKFEIIRNSEFDMNFLINSDKTGYIVTDYLCGSIDHVSIPAEHKGLPVVGIGSSAFSNHAELKEIVIPDTVESIGFQAFKGCSGVESIIIPNSVKTIEDMAFENCSGLKNVQLSVALETIGEEAFADCPFIESIELPFTLKELGERAFNNCYSLSSVKISKNTTSIGNKAFYECNSGLEFITVDGNTALSDYIASSGLTAKTKIVKDLSLGTATIDKTEYECNGSKIEPEVTVTLENGEKVTISNDYKVVYTNNGKTGTAKIYVIGIDGYGEGYIVNFDIVCQHKNAEKTIENEATCTKDGNYKCHCPDCGETYSIVIPAKGHSSNTWIYDELPTIYKTGIKHKVCSVCGEVFDKGVADKIFPDVNNDGKINSADALAILQYSTGVTRAIVGADNLHNADTNGDGKINSTDALNILQIAIELIVL